MSIPEREGVYLLCSCDAFGSRIYKVGRSDNLRQRLGSYPPNWCLLDCLPCEDSAGVEKQLIGAFRSNYKVYDRHEYFGIDADFHEIKFFFNKLLYENRKKRPVVQPKGKERKVPDRTKEAPVDMPTRGTLQELRNDRLEVFGGTADRGEVEEDVRKFNALVDVIVTIAKKPEEEQRKTLKEALAKTVSRNRAKKLLETLMTEGLGGITPQMKISKREIDQAYKR